MGRASRISESRWLGHIDLFRKGAMKECIIDVELPKRPTMCNSQTKHNPNSSRFDNRTESFRIVKARPLMETLGHQPGLVTINTSIRFAFDAENPFTPHKIMRGRWLNKIPSTIPYESIEFIRHGLTPERISNGLRCTTRFYRLG